MNHTTTGGLSVGQGQTIPAGVSLEASMVYDIRAIDAAGGAVIGHGATDENGELSGDVLTTGFQLWGIQQSAGQFAFRSDGGTHNLQFAITALDSAADHSQSLTLSQEVTPITLPTAPVPTVMRATAVTPAGAYAIANVAVVGGQVRAVQNLHGPLLHFEQSGNGLVLRRVGSAAVTAEVVIFHDPLKRQRLNANTVYDVFAVDSAGNMAVGYAATNASARLAQLEHTHSPVFALELVNGQLRTADGRPAEIRVTSPALTRIDEAAWGSHNSASNSLELDVGDQLDLSGFLLNFVDFDPLTIIEPAAYQDGWNAIDAGDMEIINNDDLSVNVISRPVMLEIQPQSAVAAAGYTPYG